ncbi:beta-N-acetylhexosaminidase [Parasphingorhabdus pacifica]
MTRLRPRSKTHLGIGAMLALLLATAGATPAAFSAPDQSSRLHDVVPAPVSVHADPSATFELTKTSGLRAGAGTRAAADQLAGILRPSTGYPLPINRGRPKRGDVELRLTADDELGPAGYRLRITDEVVTVLANAPGGLFNAVQTLRQLFPPEIDGDRVEPGPWTVPGGELVDRPRFSHRAAMLDVARHFFEVEQVKRYIDQISRYKLNYLHLHLSDDQGWRIQINSWPRLTEHGGSTEVGGGPGGYYTQQEYSEIVAYAASRNITVVPEIDMPGHTNAALSSYAELNCDGVAPPLYTGIEVGFSSLCVDKEVTYRFVDDVIRELAALTPGRYIHIGGDEADATSDEEYRTFMDRVLPIVEKHGKTQIGWHEYAKATPPPSAVVQYWGTADSDPLVAEAAARGNKILLSPANKAYLDMKYDEGTELGLDWAGYTDVADAYGWNPGSHLRDVPEESVLGVEAPLWSETLETSDDLEFMAFPRLPAVAELGWSAAETHDWEGFRRRLAAQAPRWDLLGIDYYRSPQVPWPPER